MSLLPRFALALLGCAACDADRPWPAPDPGLERMIQQPRADAYGATRWFADGKVMRPLPAGVIPYDREPLPTDMLSAAYIDDPGRAIPTAVEDVTYAASIPLPVDRELLQLGEHRFNVFCAVCHGGEGTGQSVVADVMSIRKPASLHEPRIRAFPPGRIFAVITQGYGLMPSYALQLDTRARWAVVAHVQSLQRRRESTTSQLPGGTP